MSSATRAVVARRVKLTFFDFPGRAEHIRLALRIGGVPFEDCRIPFDEWRRSESDRTRFPLGTLPTLEVEETLAPSPEQSGSGEVGSARKYVCSETLAALRLAGRLAHLYPTDPFDAMRVDDAMETVEEIYSGEWGLRHTMHVPSEKKEAMRKEFHDKALLFYGARLNDLLGEQPSGYIWGAPAPALGPNGESGSGPTFLPCVASLYVYTLFHHIQCGDVDHVPKDALKQFPHLVALFDRVSALPAVQAYHKDHPLRFF